MANCCDTCANIELPVGPTGAQGATGLPGTNGQNGTSILFNEPAERGSVSVTYVENLSTSNEQVIAPVIPANSFEADGDIVEIDAIFYINKSASGNDVLFDVKVDNQNIFNTSLLRKDVIECVRLKFIISKNSDNTLLVTWDSYSNKFFGGLDIAFFDGSGSLIIPLSLTGLDFTQNIPVSVNCTAQGIGLFRISQFIGTLKKR